MGGYPSLRGPYDNWINHKIVTIYDEPGSSLLSSTSIHNRLRGPAPTPVPLDNSNSNQNDLLLAA
jgi:hypothetical protein